MNRSFIQSRKGMALAMVLIVMAVVSILGVVVLQMTVAETRFAARDENRMKAYYLARSGVEATASWMLNPSNNGAALVGKTSGDSTLPGVTDGTFKVTVTTKSAVELLIKATGVVNGVSARAAMTLNKMGTAVGAPVFGNTIYAQQTLILRGTTTVDGDVAAGESITQNSNSEVSGTTTCPAILAAPPVVFPEMPITQSDPNLGNRDTRTLNEAGAEEVTLAYDDFTMSGGTLTIRTGTTTKSAVNIVANNMNLNGGTLKIVGNGRVNLFIKDRSSFNAEMNYSVSPASNPTKLIIYVKPSVTLKLEANVKIACFIYAPGAIVDLGGSRNITGGIFAGNVDCHGTLDVYGYDEGEDPITYDDLPVFFYSKGQWVTE